MPDARLPDEFKAKVAKTAGDLIATLRARRQESGIEGLMREYDLSSQEGVALMCLAEALLRIPDAATREALIRDKVGEGDWFAHLGRDRTLFVNAATWGLVMGRKLLSPPAETGLSADLNRMIGKWGEPIIRRAVEAAIQLLGRQFVAGETIGDALERSELLERISFLVRYARRSGDDRARCRALF